MSPGRMCCHQAVSAAAELANALGALNSNAVAFAGAAQTGNASALSPHFWAPHRAVALYFTFSASEP